MRLHYVYPYPHVDEVVPLMRPDGLLPYLDVPFQHASPRILKLMKRPADSENTLARIRAWREICPDITIRSTFIVGFPGETDSRVRGAARVSARRRSSIGSAASPTRRWKARRRMRFPIRFPSEIKLERRARLMQLQARISAAKLQRKIGRTLTVLVDEVGEHGAVARSAADAPEIDGLVYIEDADGLEPGQFVRVTVRRADEHDLYATRAA